MPIKERIAKLEEELYKGIKILKEMPEEHPLKFQYAEVILEMRVEYFNLTGRHYILKD